MSLKLLEEPVLSNIADFLNKSGALEMLKKVRKKDGRLLVLNNTFFFRDRAYIKTNKNKKYLAIPAAATDITNKNVLVLTGPRLNSEYKLISDSDDTIEKTLSLADAIKQEI